MKIQALTTALIFGITVLLFTNAMGQSATDKKKKQHGFYTFFLNVAPDNSSYPLIGFINIAKGNHKTLQLSFINTTLKNFKGLQTGFVNTTLGNINGTQLGFVNTTSDSVSGALQLGFVNTAANYMKGLQLGLVNVAAKTIKGNQIGFINFADSVTGVSIAFFPVVKKGAYRAIEISANELYPLNLAFKIGVPKFYSFIQGNYNSKYRRQFTFGFGFGSLMHAGKRFYLNPEIGTLAPVSIDNKSLTTTLAVNLRYSINPKVQLFVGPSVVWLNYPTGEQTFKEPLITLSDKEVGERNRILTGCRVGLSYNFTSLK